MSPIDENPRDIPSAASGAAKIRSVAVLGALLLGQISFVRVVLWPDVPVDDAWIAFRYARNFVAGHGLVFNPGEWVEGYSSLTWTLLMSLPALLGLDVATFARLTGFLFGAWTTLLIGRRSLLAAAWLSASVPALYHFCNGLETPLVAFLLTSLVLSRSSTTRECALTTGIAVVLSWTRPEGLLAVFLWCALRSAVRNADPNVTWRERLRHQAPIALAAFTAWGVQTGARWITYGDWIANSARAKLVPLGFALPHGLRDLGDFGWTGGAFGGLALLVAAGAASDFVRSRGSQLPRLGLSIANARRIFLVAYALLLARSGGDSFPMWRFLVPLLPLFVLEAARSLHALIPPRAWRPALLRGAAGMAIVAGLVVPVQGYLEALRGEGRLVRHWTEVGQQLRKIAPPDARLAVSPSGALPYHAGLETVDMLGLTEPRIARSAPDLRYFYPGHQRHDGRRVLDREPDIVVVGNAPHVDSDTASFPWGSVRIYERDVVSDPRFRASFRLIRVPLPSGGFALMFARAELIPRLRLAREAPPVE